MSSTCPWGLGVPSSLSFVPRRGHGVPAVPPRFTCVGCLPPPLPFSPRPSRYTFLLSTRLPFVPPVPTAGESGQSTTASWPWGARGDTVRAPAWPRGIRDELLPLPGGSGPSPPASPRGGSSAAPGPTLAPPSAVSASVTPTRLRQLPVRKPLRAPRSRRTVGPC